MAYYNLYYIIPGTYIVHILPFHILEWMKDAIKRNEPKAEEPAVVSEGAVPSEKPATVASSLPSYSDIKSAVDKYSFANPLSPQGMLIFGAVSSAYALKK